MLKILRSFVRLPVATQALALEAALLLLLARLLVERVPMRYWRHRLDTAPDPPAGRAEEGGNNAPPAPRLPRRVGRIVRKVARRAPFRALCLPQAMAAQWMLRRRGVRSRIVFGARRRGTPGRALEFHAWLIVAGECVLGAEEARTFTPLPPPAAT